MNTDDEFLRQRLSELREQDESRAPSFDRVLRGRGGNARTGPARPSWRLAMGPVAAAAGVCVGVGVIVTTLQWRAAQGGLLEPSGAAVAALEAAVEPIPSDGLLAGVDGDEIAALLWEIEVLLSR